MSKLSYLDRVKQPTTTTGTGDIVFSGSVAGYNQLSTHAYLEYGTSFPYLIEAVDANNIPTGEWETGIGRLRGVGDANPTHMIRLVVRSSSNADAIVNFSAGTKLVSICVNADLVQGLRSATAEFWVRTDGANSNDGGANTDARAFDTIQDAVNAAAKFTLLTGSDVNVTVTAGTYSETVDLPYYSRTTGRLVLSGNGGAMDDVVITGGVSCCGHWAVTNLKITNGASSPDLTVFSGGEVELWDVEFGSSGSAPQILIKSGGRLKDAYTYVSAGGASHLRVESGGSARLKRVDFLANATYSSAFVDCLNGSGHIDVDGATIALGGFTVTGPRYDIRGNGVCYTNGGGASFFPGSSAGSTASGGQYL